jgi:hypothetical protein
MKTINHYIFLITCLFAFPLLLTAQQNYFSKVIYDSTYDFFAWSCAKSYDNSYIIGGTTGLNGLLIKTDSAGDIIWSKRIVNNGSTNINQVISTKDSCILLVGGCSNITQTNGDIFYLKTNTNGDTLWSGSIDFGSNEYATSIVQTIDNGFIIVGISNEYPSNPNSNIFICKLNTNGNITWAKKILGGGNLQNKAYSVKQTADSGYIITGYISDQPGPYNPTWTYLIKLSQNGNDTWAKKFKSTSLSDIIGYDVIPSDNGFTVLVAAVNNFEYGLLRTDSIGNLIWSRSYYKNQTPESFSDNIKLRLHQSMDGGYLFATPGLNFSQLLIKVNSIGIPKWSKNLSLFSPSVLENPDKGIYLVGNGAVYGAKDKYLNHAHIGIIKTDSSDNSFNNCNYNVSINFDTLLITGNTYAFTIVSAGIASPAHPVISNITLSQRNGCVDVYGSVEEHKAEDSFLVYPNPANSNITFTTNQNDSSLRLDILDINGRLVQSYECKGPKKEMNVSDYKNGVYILKITSAEQSSFVKFIKM